MSEVADRTSLYSNGRGSTRPWSVRVIILLLALQAIILFSLGLLGNPWITWPQALHGAALATQSVESIFVSSILLTLAIMAVLAIPCLWLTFRTGWLVSMSLQALLLATCIVLYFEDRPIFIYPLMIVCIIIVLYLNSYDVRSSFHVGSARAQPEVKDGA